MDQAGVCVPMPAGDENVGDPRHEQVAGEAVAHAVRVILGDPAAMTWFSIRFHKADGS